MFLSLNYTIYYILADPADFVLPQSINKNDKLLYKKNLKQTNKFRNFF